MSLTTSRPTLAPPASAPVEVAAPASPGPRRALIGAWVLIFALDLIPSTSVFAMPVLALLTVAAIIWAIFHHHPAKAWTWWFVVGAIVLFTIGGAARVKFNTLGNLTSTRSMLPDLLILPGYGLLATALVGFVVARTGHTQRRLSTICDGLIAGLAMLALSWVFLIEPLLAGADTDGELRIVLVCYPAMSLFLAIITMQVIVSNEHRRTPAEKFLIATMSAMFVGDALYMLAEIGLVSRTMTSLLDIPYLIAYASAASCALQPSMRGFTERGNEGELNWTPGRVLLVAVAFIIPALLFLFAERDPFGSRVALFMIVIALTCTGILQLVQALNSVERSEARLKFQALHDGLTGLPNRRLLEDHLRESLERNVRSRGLVGLLFLDLDRFKLINDTLGHSHGDELLMQVAERLRQNIRSEDLIARIGGDEFLVVLNNPATLEEARDTANRLRQCLRSPFAVEGTEFFITASIGLACSSEEVPTDVEGLIRDADTAMYQAKEGGRDAVAVFDDSMREEIEARVEIEHDLRWAVERRELHLVYQPVVALGTSQVTGFEALVRWAHPTLGVILPSRFIPLAEESDLIVELGSWVLDEALRQLALSREQHPGADLTMAVNVSAIQLRDGLLVERVRTALRRHGLPGSALCIELTESEIMRDPNTAIAALNALRKLDVRVAVDDFGTEYSSLAYLQRLPVDILKIDFSFVKGLREPDNAAESLVAAIIAMAKALSIETIAEGVEVIAQANALRRLGCDSVQGYLYARPVRADQLFDLLQLLSQSHDDEHPLDGAMTAIAI